MKRSKLFIFFLVLIFSLTSVTFADTLKYGSSGAEVTKLQEQLKKLGLFSGKTTGYFGSVTRAAVKKIQAAKGIAVDGIVGRQTKKVLLETGTSSRSLKSRDGTGSVIQASRIEAVNAEKKAVQELKEDTGAAEAKAEEKEIEVTEPDCTEINEGEEEGLQLEEDTGEEPVETDIKGKIEVLDWFTSASKVFARGSNAKVTDVRTGKSFYIKRTYGGNHADCETLTKEDTKIMKEIWGGTFNWSRRPVIIEIDGRLLAASMAGMPHAGLDNKPVNATISSRSGGYGRGTNLDTVKNNNMNGHFDVHFKNSRTHGTNRVDSAHQKAVKEAAAAKF